MITHRVQPWRAWMKDVRSRLLDIECTETVPSVRAFFSLHYATHTPLLFKAPICPAMTEWSRDRLLERAGNPMVEVQAGRTRTPDYEIESSNLKTLMPLAEFLNLVFSGKENDVYLTANNAATNRDLTAALFQDMLPLPPMLRELPDQCFLWIGNKTVTPLHHDLTQNMMIQLCGRKRVRVISPTQQHLLDNHKWVFSAIPWPTDEICQERGITAMDYYMQPGDALFLPVGWWHCVDTEGFSITTTVTSFPWLNSWSTGFPA